MNRGEAAESSVGREDPSFRRGEGSSHRGEGSPRRMEASFCWGEASPHISEALFVVWCEIRTAVRLQEHGWQVESCWEASE